jgi:hypothetical protein
VAESAIARLFQAASINCGSPNAAAYQRSENPSQTVKREEGEGRRGVAGQQQRIPGPRRALHRRRPARREGTAAGKPGAQQRRDQSHQSQRKRRAERPVAGRRQLVLHERADHDGLAAAHQVGREIRSQTRDEHEQRARGGARRRQGNDHPEEHAQRPRSQIRRRLHQRPVDAFQSRVERKHHEGKVAVHQPEDHRAVVVEQRQRFADQPGSQKQGVEQAGFAQQEEPGVGAHEEAGPERQHDERQIEIAARAGTGDEQRQGETRRQADQRGGARQQDRAPEDPEVQRVGHPHPVFQRPRRFHAAVSAAAQHAVSGDDGQRADEQQREHQTRGREEESAQAGHCSKQSSSAGRHQT